MKVLFPASWFAVPLYTPIYTLQFIHSNLYTPIYTFQFIHSNLYTPILFTSKNLDTFKMHLQKSTNRHLSNYVFLYRHNS
jgi:hypothetical protein